MNVTHKSIYDTLQGCEPSDGSLLYQLATMNQQPSQFMHGWDPAQLGLDRLAFLMAFDERFMQALDQQQRAQFWHIVQLCRSHFCDAFNNGAQNHSRMLQALNAAQRVNPPDDEIF